jgi:hypothetical protein
MHFTDHLRQAVGLGEKGRSRWNAILVTPSRATRGKDERKTGLYSEGPMGEVTAIASTQIDIREQDIDRLLTEDDLGLFGTGCGQNRKPGLFQGLGCRRTNHQIVLDHENVGGTCLWGYTRGLGGSIPESWDQDHAGPLPSGVRLSNPEPARGVHNERRLPLGMVSGPLTTTTRHVGLDPSMSPTKTSEQANSASSRDVQTKDATRDLECLLGIGSSRHALS